MNPEKIFKSVPLLRVVLVVPIGILTVFVLFNLLAVPDQTSVQSALKVGIVNEDNGVAMPVGQVKIAENLLSGLAGHFPVGVKNIDSFDKAKAALDSGEIAAIIHFPAAFSTQVLGTGPVSVDLVTARHLSAVETQIGATMSANISAGLDTAVGAIRTQFAQQMAAAQAAAKAAVAARASGKAPGAMSGPPSAAMAAPVPVVNLNATNLYESRGGVLEAGPRILSFPLWLASLAAAVIGFALLRRKDQELGPVPVSVVPAVIMIPSFAVASLFAVLSIGIVGSFPAAWGELWMFLWLGTLAIGWCVWGLIRIFGLWSLVVLLPLVFLQSMVAGVAYPVAAAPSWISWLAPLVPSEAITHGVSHYLLGGPANVDWGTLFGFAGLGLALTIIGVIIRVLRFKSLGKVTRVSLT